MQRPRSGVGRRRDPDRRGGRDLVGIYADGAIHHGFASSLGQRNWYQSHTFNFDWSFYLHGDKAVKNTYGGQAWNSDAFSAKVEAANHQLESLARPAIDLKPGRYRTYLSQRPSSSSSESSPGVDSG